ncbi:CpaD family pilus assembly lipoprotein [Curvibacter sp. CHRR-16]|uniref:CpaD family pilus assembly lipoprotein n=1 Tax=Curvibacter sp. CHRR-16 TaxID=2835872 RepID=UPI001BDA940E|nr:CpaD family pilus assembly lipoprotein [Curvibacter sp. CHRR-16]MBT0570735.1 CpaD family pilus assembly lipoprotein [Curvibacter sp. CHRR-16]
MNPPSFTLISRLLVLVCAVCLSACQTPLNDVRAARFSAESVQAPTVQPRALALPLHASADEKGLTPESLKQANAMLSQQGRLQAQTLTITPFNARGETLAKRLAKALVASGAKEPQVLAIPSDATRLEDAKRHGGDLELQSDALVISMPECGLARANDWMVNPYTAIGPLGCANRANLARMVSDPRDLARPRALAGADGSAAVLAVQRYQEADIRDLIDIDFDQ